MALGLRPIASAPIGALLDTASNGVPEDIFGANLVHWYRDGWTGTEAVDLVNSANNMTAASGRAPSAGAVNGHVTADFPGVDEVIACSDVSTVAGATEITIGGAFKLSSGQAAYGCIIGKLYGGVEFHVGANATGDRLIASVGVNFDVDAATSNADPFDNTWHRFVYTWNNVSGGVLYLDGVAQTITEPAGQGAVPDASEFLSMGGVTADNSTVFDYFATGEIANVFIANREANGTEVTDLDDYLDAWLSSVNAYTLTAAQASFTWTRNAANVRAQRRITAAQASFTHTGQAANVRAQRRIVAAQASFTETGQAATFLRTIRMTAVQASYVLSGQAANVRAQRRITAAQGSLALSGQAANVRAQRRVAAAQAAFALTGQASSFVRSVRMVAVQASYALTGQVANVRAQRRVTAAQASFTWTRNAATLSTQRRIAAAQASFAETGQTATLTKQSRIVAALGTYALTGQPAGLVYGSVGSYTLSAAHGFFTLSGQASGVRAQRRITAAQGSLTMSGQAAGLLRGLRMPAAQASYTWTRNAAGLTGQRRVTAAQASYSISGQAALVRPGRRLSAAFAAYTLTGQAANLIVPRRITAAQGSFALSGVAANLNGGRRLSAGLALYALTGTATTFSLARRLTAGAGTFTLTGFDAALASTTLFADWFELRPRASRSLDRILVACPTIDTTLRASSGTLVRLIEPSASYRATPEASSSERRRPRVSRSLDRILTIRTDD